MVSWTIQGNRITAILNFSTECDLVYIVHIRFILR